MLFLVSDWCLPWSPVVSCSDSSLYGFGICCSRWPLEEVSAAGRVLEKSRFRLKEHSARDSALTSAGFVKDDAGHWQAGTDSRWDVDPEFPEVPSRGLHRRLWEPKLWGPWRHAENIFVLESRALVKALRRLALTARVRNMRLLFLVDNMSVCLSFDRSRCRDFKVLVQIRRFVAFCLAKNLKVAIRWIPSELNNSDEPSRIFDRSGEESHLLTDQIAGWWEDGGHVSVPSSKGLGERTDLPKHPKAPDAPRVSFSCAGRSCAPPGSGGDAAVLEDKDTVGVTELGSGEEQPARPAAKAHEDAAAAELDSDGSRVAEEGSQVAGDGGGP